LYCKFFRIQDVIDFEWDENNNKSNREKHGLDFKDAKEVFNDKGRLNSIDNKKDYGEERYILIGKAFNAIIVVIFTQREKVIRIISARLASRNERSNYLNRKK